MLRARETMNGNQKRVCIIAWPAGHSRSPLIHNYWIKQHNLDAEYRREAVPPEKFEDFITHLRDNGYIGANVSVPHKEKALALSEPDERARARRRRQLSVVRGRHAALDQHRRRRFSRQSRHHHRRAGTAGWKAPWCSAPAAAPAR